MTDAIVVLVLCLSAIPIGLFFEWLVRGRKQNLDLARMVATNDAVARAIVDRVNRDAERRAIKYREVRQ